MQYLILYILSHSSLYMFNVLITVSCIGQVVSRGAFSSFDMDNASYNCSIDGEFSNATIQALCGSCGG